MAGKWVAKEENGNNRSSKEEVEVTLTKGDSNPGSGSGNPETGTYNPGGKEDHREEEPTQMDNSMIFMIPAELCVPTEDVADLALGAERAVFRKPKNPSAHMKPLFIRRHLGGMPVGHVLVDGGASINILSLSLFKKLGHIEGDPTEAKGIICKELMVGSKIVPMAFFVVDIKGHYNVLLGGDWIHATECVPSTLHQCVTKWIGDEVEVVQAEEDVCITMTESQVNIQGGKMKRLTDRDLIGYNYVSISKDGFVLISVKPIIATTRLAHDLV
jgi:hypothetical protein